MAGSHSNRQGAILTMPSEAPIFNKLTLRMIAPVVLVVCAVGIGFYFFVLRTISDDAEQEIRASLARNAREIYDICDSNFTTLLQNGQMGNAKMVRIRRALTLGGYRGLRQTPQPAHSPPREKRGSAFIFPNRFRIDGQYRQIS
jgi:hypothetical protein